LTKILIIGVGGFVGAVTRYYFGNYVQGLTRSTTFPYGTLTINVLGCLLIGFLFNLPALHKTLDAEARLLLITGFLGAFTTFSTFGNESMRMFQKNEIGLALAYIAASLLGGLIAVWVGQWFASAVR
jgi:CrcB protein